jgi:hypothetical protein
MKEEIFVKELVIEEVLVELIDITHLFTQQEGLMYMKIP